MACLLVGPPGEQPHKEVRTSRTVTRDLEALLDWLKEAGVTHVGMESTGVYWRPVYAVLEGHFELIVGNARHIRNVPGCKTDVKDSEWIADLVRHGLIAKSFVPPQTAAGAARAAALPPQAGRKPDGRTQPAPEASGNHQHQAGERRFRRLRRVRPGDAPGADRGRGLARGDGRSRPGPASPKARRSDPRARVSGGEKAPIETLLHGSMRGSRRPLPAPTSCDADGVRASQLQHAVQDMDGDGNLGRATLILTEAESVTDHLFVSPDGSLDAAALVVT